MTGEVTADQVPAKEPISAPVPVVPPDVQRVPDMESDNDLDRSSKKFGHLSESEYNDYVRRRRRRKKPLPDHPSRPVSPELSGEGKTRTFIILC